ncbi:MAG TPA: hypothetical protein VMU81_06860 [Acetobacteraceae bacterium]|jgi:hypothetical protein|nr:hypothetical protein [Acetobacteraceae bacterium]
MTVLRFCLLGALGAALFACAPASSPAPKPAPPPADPVDGVYRGTSTWYLAQSRSCPHPGLVTLYVQDGQFFYRWDYATWVNADIEPDGTVRGQAKDITLLGKRVDKHMQGDITNGVCGLHFTVTWHDM